MARVQVWYSIPEVARMVAKNGRHIDESTIRYMCRDGVLKNRARRDGWTWLVPKDVAEDLAENWRKYSRWAPKATRKSMAGPETGASNVA